MKRAEQSCYGSFGPWVLSLGIVLVVVGVSSAASDSHRKDGPADEDHARDQEGAEQDRQREQNKAAHCGCQQGDPDFELFQSQCDQRSHNDDRNSDGDGKSGIHFDELPQPTRRRQPVLQSGEDEPNHLSSSFDAVEVWQIFVHDRCWKWFRTPVLCDHFPQTLGPRWAYDR
jgi:hypothetical protein